MVDTRANDRSNYDDARAHTHKHTHTHARAHRGRAKVEVVDTRAYDSLTHEDAPVLMQKFVVDGGTRVSKGVFGKGLVVVLIMIRLRVS